MAKSKTKKFTGDTTITINPKSKNAVYEYKGTEDSYTFNLTPVATSGYNSQYKTVTVKNNNDLVMTTIFASNTGKIKKITTTIKGYFTDKNANYIVKYATTIGNNEPTTYIIEPDTTEGRKGLYGAKYEEFYGVHYRLAPTDSPDTTMTLNGLYSNHVYNTLGNNKYSSNHDAYNDYIYDMSGNDTYNNISNTEGGALWTYDYAGEDEYNVSYTKTSYATDYSGNDSYNIDMNATLYATDFKGNDEYVYASKSLNSTVTDYAGNDNYITTYDPDGTQGGKLSVQDKSGNDTYEGYFKSELVVNDSAGNDSYYIEQDGTMTIYDSKGKDTYKASAGKILNVTDKTGKDKYEILGTKAVINDKGKGNDSYFIAQYTKMEYNYPQPDFLLENEKGNETYNIAALNYDVLWNDDSLSSIYDYSGNDKYNLAKKGTYYADIKNVRISDMKGNDKYTLTIADDTDQISGVAVYDANGSDTYKLNAIDNNKIKNVFIFEYKGKDNYSFSKVQNFEIYDNSGSDKYTIASGNGASLKRAKIEDDAGNDKYTISNSEWFSVLDKTGNDKYTFTNANNFDITDAKGNDKYTIKKGVNISLADNAGKDKYTFTSSEGEIHDETGNDTYTFSASSFAVWDKKGNDKYTIKNTTTSPFYINDDSGNDSYKVSMKNSSGFTHIEDKNGNKDSLILSDVKKGNIVFMTDITKEGLYSDKLYIYNKTNESLIQLDNFYTYDENGITGFGVGKIETVKVGSSKISKAQSTALYQDFNSLKSEVSGWLSKIGYLSVSQVLNTENDYKADLVKIFTNQNLS